MSSKKPGATRCEARSVNRENTGRFNQGNRSEGLVASQETETTQFFWERWPCDLKNVLEAMLMNIDRRSLLASTAFAVGFSGILPAQLLA